MDLLRQAQLAPVAITITGGEAVVKEAWNRYRVPKRDLVSTMQVLLETGRLKVAAALPEAAMLVQELLAFQVKITSQGHATYGDWREGRYDDLALAVALTC